MKKLVVWLGVALLCLCLPSLAGEKTPLTIYTAREAPFIEVVVPQFEKAYPQYEVEVLRIPTQQILERTRAEKANPHGDVWWGGTIQQFMQAANDGLLESYTPTFSGRIAQHHRDADHRWYGEVKIPELIVYNTDVLKPEEAPQDWDELLDAKWKDKIVIRGVIPSGTMRTIYSFLIYRQDKNDPAKGYDWLRRLDANTKTYATNPNNLWLALARQEAVVSLWSLMDVFSQRNNNNQPFGYILPKSGMPILIDCVAIVKGSKNAQGAKDFYEFLFSDKIRSELSAKCGQISTLDLPPELTPDWLKSIAINEYQLDWNLIVQKEAEWMEYWDQNIKGKKGK